MDRVDDGFPAWLEATMRSRGLSQAQLARTLGVGEAQVSRWRRGLAVPTVRSLQRLAVTLGVARTTLDQLAGYPTANVLEPSSCGRWSAEQAGELHAYQAALAQLLEQRVPRELWQVYVSGCEALAAALEQSFDTTLRRADRLRGTEPGVDDASAGDAGSWTPSSGRQLGFGAPGPRRSERGTPAGEQSGERHGHPDGGGVDQSR